jgi:lipopolysaccharide assembly protein A
MIFVFSILGVIALAIVVLFSVQNAMPVTVWFYNWRFDASLAIVVFLSVLAGMVIETLFVVSLRLGKSVKRKVRKTNRPEEGTPPRGENMGHTP